MNKQKTIQGKILVIKETENINPALKKFKKKSEESNILKNLRRKKFFE